MVKITFRPYGEIIIHEIVMLKVPELVERLPLDQSGKASPLLWANKILFLHSYMEGNDDIIREQLENKVHWAAVQFAICEKYQPQLRSSGNIPIPVYDVSTNKIMNEVTQWLYEQAISDKPPF